MNIQEALHDARAWTTLGNGSIVDFCISYSSPPIPAIAQANLQYEQWVEDSTPFRPVLLLDA